MIRDAPPPFVRDDIQSSWFDIDAVLKSADIDLEQSLFFVYALNREQNADLVCYGTGGELRRLLNMKEETPDHTGEIGQQFLMAMNNDDKREVRRIVEIARSLLIKRHPHAEVLLSTIARKDSEELQEILADMAEHRLNRILLVSDRAPLERGIVGGTELSNFLINQ